MAVAVIGNEQINRLMMRLRRIGASMDGESHFNAGSSTEAQAAERLLVDGTYRIIGEIGTGAHGAVFRANDEVLHREVAIKIVNDTSLTNNPHVQKRFVQEAKVLSTLHHENVVQIFRTGLLPDNSPYLVMEYLEGETLAAHMKHKKLTLPEICQIALAVSEGMQHIHSFKVVHRDLKPENVMVNESNYLQSKILDFGISKILEGDVSERRDTTTVPIKGTCAYMSPEQARGEQTDERSDIYSFTCMLFEMLTTEKPFSAETPAMLMMKHLQENAPHLGSHGNNTRAAVELTKKLNQIIERGLKKAKSERYQSFKDLIGDLHQAQALVLDGSERQTLSFIPDRSERKAVRSLQRYSIALALFMTAVFAFLAWNLLEPRLKDDHFLNASAEKAIPHFTNKVGLLLTAKSYPEAAQLVDKTVLNAKTWSKKDRTSMLLDYFNKYKVQDQSIQEIRSETRKIALDLYSDQLHWGREYHRKSHPTVKESEDKAIWIEDFQDVGKYLLEDTERNGGWEEIAALYAKHQRSIPNGNAQYYKTAALLRLGAEENCPQKCGEDADLLSENCVAASRIITNDRVSSQSEIKKVNDRVIALLKKRGQKKDLDLVHCELAIYYLVNNQPKLGMEERNSIHNLGKDFGTRTDECYSYMGMESLLGLQYCRNGDKAAAVSQLRKTENILHADAFRVHGKRNNRGPDLWERYQKFIALPPEKAKDKTAFSYPLSKEQADIAQGDPGFTHGYRLRRAVIDTFGKDSVKGI